MSAPVRPGITTTGPRKSRGTLTPREASTITSADTVVEGAIITGLPQLKKAVTFRDCIFRPAAPQKLSIATTPGLRDVRLEHCEIDGRAFVDGNVVPGKVEVGIEAPGSVIEYCNIHHVNDGVRLNTDTELAYSWVHDLVKVGSFHPDCVQTISGSGGRIHHSYLDGQRVHPTTGVWVGYANACWMVNQARGTNGVFELTDSWLAGGGFSVNIVAYPTADQLVIERNIFEGRARWGAILAPHNVQVDNSNTLPPAMDKWNPTIKRFGPEF